MHFQRVEFYVSACEKNGQGWVSGSSSVQLLEPLTRTFGSPPAHVAKNMLEDSSTKTVSPRKIKDDKSASRILSQDPFWEIMPPSFKNLGIAKKLLWRTMFFDFLGGGRRHEPPKWSLARSMNCYRKHHHNDSKTSKIWYNNKNLHFEYFLNFSWETAAGAFKLGPGLKHGLATQENTIKCVRNKSLSWVACKKSGTEIVISGHWPRLVDWTKTNLVHANFLDVYFPHFWVSPRLD